MGSQVGKLFREELYRRFPSTKKLGGSNSLYQLDDMQGRVYIRYSKVHHGAKTFYGLRRVDLQQLEGQNSLLCFLWDGQAQPLVIPFAAFEDVFQSIEPADDGQFKAQVYLRAEGAELYIAGAGRFNVESYFGWNEFEIRSSDEYSRIAASLSHSQVQSLLAAIGFAKGNDIWIPAVDRAKMDAVFSNGVRLHTELPSRASAIASVLSEVDVIWLKRGSSEISALFEVEHSTPIYSGLLRFNDFHLIDPGARARFSVVSNDARRSQFVRQVNRPTFRTSGLVELCTFLEYVNVFEWWQRLCGDT